MTQLAFLHREWAAVFDSETVLPAGDSDLAQQIFKDPYLFDFLGIADPRRDSEVEQALIDADLVDCMVAPYGSLALEARPKFLARSKPVDRNGGA